MLVQPRSTRIGLLTRHLWWVRASVVKHVTSPVNRRSPIYDVSAVLTSIQSLLTDPNPNSPANSEAAKLYRDDRRMYERRVREMVEKSLEDDDDDE